MTPKMSYLSLAVNIGTDQTCKDPEGGGGHGVGTPWKNMPSSAHQRNAIEMAFRWRADGDLLRILVWTPSPILKNRVTKAPPPSP